MTAIELRFFLVLGALHLMMATISFAVILN